jgi:hypothetical protein
MMTLSNDMNTVTNHYFSMFKSLFVTGKPLNIKNKNHRKIHIDISILTRIDQIFCYGSLFNGIRKPLMI